MAAGKLRQAFDACLILKSLICNISVFKKYQVQRINAKFITFTINPEDLIFKNIEEFLEGFKSPAELCHCPEPYLCPLLSIPGLYWEVV